ncbi:CpsD/CapB family tyrosine-protein kinase [Photobacterium phosphoreum]|uniref:CpsD/CapB family tyrosine-protein kinase n=1 Tax=Photobacterium phosphoreum TaxID=659 RepID=UPI0005D3C12D|nr:CpsD/CapB family tyrosine-protein kinase [Photobacterium phosphoreum]KJF86661.1 chromosome partitioning protein ParA [Photobacterium phosphoreum]MCD9501117.1 chromosome partitioning protein ParA [Photobacterium phosphoreum]OBU35817.1 chromosome partitioning protein ParA [Photobacterium phosphoreum]PQJ90949.1 chromosome partitioning protein ParA [Photobacterium phosphoreum]PSV72806.1 chromosome partitioning protein ParA [Photobacterium phosphoreum]
MKIPSYQMEIEDIFLFLEQQNYHSICITSSNPQEGVTSIAQAITERYLLAGYRTLLVDLNVQNPSLIPLIDIINKSHQDQNLNNYLTYDAHNKVGLLGASIINNKAHIIELRQPQNLKLKIDAWLLEFDKIIIDTSPLSQSSLHNIPAHTVASCCDGTILIVLSGKTQQNEIKDTIEKLTVYNAQLIGLVFNDKLQPHIKDEICREINRCTFLPEKITTKLIHFIQHNRFLSILV